MNARVTERGEPSEYRLKELTLEITNACPLKCKHCSSFAGRPLEDELTLAQVRDIIDDFDELGGEILEISGGEPFSSPHTYNTIEYAKHKGLRVYVYTCGVAESRSEPKPIGGSLVDKMANLNVDKFYFNLQGASPKVHEQITRVDGSFRTAIDSIKNLIRSGFYVGIHIVPMKPNYKEIGSLVNLAESLGVREVALLRFVPQGRGDANRRELELSVNEFRELITAANEIKAESNPKINVRMGAPINFCFLVDDSLVPPRCTAGKDKCLISPEGNVFPCPAFKQNSNFIAGNVKQDSLINIWRKSLILSQFRNSDWKDLEGYCKACPFLSKCKGRCAAQRTLAHKGINKGPDPHCFAIQLIKIREN